MTKREIATLFIPEAVDPEYVIDASLRFYEVPGETVQSAGEHAVTDIFATPIDGGIAVMTAGEYFAGTEVTE